MRILDWLRSWFRISQAVQHTSVLLREVKAAKNKLRKSDAWIEDQAQEVTSIIATFHAKLATVQQSNKQYENTIEKLRSEAEVHALEIKMLTESHTRFFERYRAETAVEVHKQVAAKARDGG